LAITQFLKNRVSKQGHVPK